MTSPIAFLSSFAGRGRAKQRRTLLVAGIAHALHDGYTDLIYLLLPVWQAEFGLGYAALGLLRGLYAGAMAALQVPSGFAASRFGGRMVLALGTALSALDYLLAGFTGSLLGLCVALAVAGCPSPKCSRPSFSWLSGQAKVT